MSQATYKFKNIASDQRGGGRGITGKEGEGLSQGTCTKDPWTRTTGED